MCQIELPEGQGNFHLEEFKSLRTEVLGLLVQVDSVVRYTLISAAAVFSWLATQGIGIEDAAGLHTFCTKLPKEVIATAWWIPAGFSLLASIWATCIMVRVSQMGGYLRELEGSLGNCTLGWEKYLRDKWPMMRAFLVILWVLVLAGTLAIGYIGAKQVLGMQICPPPK